LLGLMLLLGWCGELLVVDLTPSPRNFNSYRKNTNKTGLKLVFICSPLFFN